MAKKVSIIYRTRNYKDRIMSTIHSISQLIETNWELMIMNDASEDETELEVKKIIEKLNDKRIKYYRNEEPIGKAKTLNLGAKKAKGEFLCFIEDGVLWDPYKLSMQLEAYEDNGQFGMYYGYISDLEENFVPEKNNNKELLKGDIFLLLLIKNQININSIFMKKEIWTKYQGLVENLEEDPEWELFLRISRDYPIYFDGTVLGTKQTGIIEHKEPKQILYTQYFILEQFFEYYNVFDMVEGKLNQMLQLAIDSEEKMYYASLYQQLEKQIIENREEKENNAIAHICRIRQVLLQYIAALIMELHDIISFLDTRRWAIGRRKLELCYPKIAYLATVFKIIKEAMEYDVEETIKQVMRQGYTDEILLGDLIKSCLIPQLEEIAIIFSTAKVEEGIYKIEPTQSGYFTLNIKDKYMHSNINPMLEGQAKAKMYYDPNQIEYNIFGDGLGYVCYQLYILSMGGARINLYEPDQKIIDYAYEYGVLGNIPSENLRVMHDPTGIEFLTQIEDNVEGSILELTTVWTMENKKSKEVLFDLYQIYGTDINLGEYMQVNERLIRQKKNFDYYLDDLLKLTTKEDVIVVAAGPSLNERIDWIKEQQGKMTIIAVTTIAKRLLMAGITPDFIVVTDPQERTYGHMKGIRNTKVPLVIGKKAYWKFAKNHIGKRYLITYQDENKEGLVEGKTVTSLAVELAIAFKNTKQVYLAGVDLAFVNGDSHAMGTMDFQKETDNQRAIEVLAVNGEMVKTSPVFKIYLKEIEEKIANAPQITFYNLSKGGAKIEGTKET